MYFYTKRMYIFAAAKVTSYSNFTKKLISKKNITYSTNNQRWIFILVYFMRCN